MTGSGHRDPAASPTAIRSATVRWTTSPFPSFSVSVIEIDPPALRPGVTAAPTTAVLATGDGPGVTALATTAVLATG